MTLSVIEPEHQWYWGKPVGHQKLSWVSRQELPIDSQPE